MSRLPPYAWRQAFADFGGARIERIQIRETLELAIRFSDWRGGRFNPRALELPEDELLVLLGDALARGVFSREFVNELGQVLDVQSGGLASGIRFRYA